MPPTRRASHGKEFPVYSSYSRPAPTGDISVVPAGGLHLDPAGEFIPLGLLGSVDAYARPFARRLVRLIATLSRGGRAQTSCSTMTHSTPAASHAAKMASKSITPSPTSAKERFSPAAMSFRCTSGTQPDNF